MKAFIFALVLACIAAAPMNPPALKINPPKLESSVGICGKNSCEGANMVSTVVKKGDKYQYTYILTNYGKKKTLLVGCSVPDIAMGWSSNKKEISQYYKLKPGKSVTITVMHEKPPTECLGSIRCLGKGSREEEGVTIKGATVYTSQMGGLANGYVPKGDK